MSNLNRREFVVGTLSVAACACLCSVCETEAAPPAAGPVDVGTIADFPKDGISNKFVRDHKFFVIRNEGKIYASTAMCPHKGRVLNIKDPKNLTCPGHKSAFSIQGTVTKGPANESLVRFAISKNEKGKLLVDKSKSFRENQWEDPESFVQT